MAPREIHCAYCGTVHDRHEDAACGCGCGDNPMGCGPCMMEGGPPRRYDSNGKVMGPRVYGYDEDPYGDRYEFD